MTLLGNIFKVCISDLFNFDVSTLRYLCPISVAWFYATLQSSMSFVVFMAADRFYATYFPFKYQQKVSMYTTNKNSIFIAAFALLVALLFTFLHSVDAEKHCFGLADYVNEPIGQFLLVVHRLFFIVVPFLAAVIFNILIVFRLQCQAKIERFCFSVTFSMIHLLNVFCEGIEIAM